MYGNAIDARLPVRGFEDGIVVDVKKHGGADGYVGDEAEVQRHITVSIRLAAGYVLTAVGARLPLRFHAGGELEKRRRNQSVVTRLPTIIISVSYLVVYRRRVSRRSTEVHQSTGEIAGRQL